MNVSILYSSIKSRKGVRGEVHPRRFQFYIVRLKEARITAFYDLQVTFQFYIVRLKD